MSPRVLWPLFGAIQVRVRVTHVSGYVYLCHLIVPRLYRFECECRDGYEGDSCESNIDDCVEHQCGNGGECLDDVAGYSCQCPDT